MNPLLETCYFLLPCIFLFSGKGIEASSYDYYATTECLKEPRGAFYGGGVIANPGFDHSIEGWHAFGHAEVEERVSKDGNRFIVARARTNKSDSFSQTVHVEQGTIYCFSAWVQVSEGSETVSAVFRPAKGRDMHVGSVIAKSGCWSLLKGGIVSNFSSPVEIFFESKNISVEIWVENVSLQPFTKQQWRSHQDDSINEVRRRKVRFRVTGADKTPQEGAKLFVKQTKPGFPFGCAMKKNILKQEEYQKWFIKRFKHTVFTNEMKWYSTEKTQGQENYTIADSMVQFAQRNGIAIRGHNVFWADPKYQPFWVNSLSGDALRSAAAKRMSSVVSRYKGKVISWDVMNENLHFSFFEDKLGPNASAEAFYTAQRLDPSATMFLNDFNTIEYKHDPFSTPFNYHKKIVEILSFPGKTGNLSAGIGLQGRFGPDPPNLAFMRAGLDTLATTGLPIWITELNVAMNPKQGQFLEEILREAYSYPAVRGIIMFAGPKPANFSITQLTDEHYNNTPAGDAVDKLIKEWGSSSVVETVTDRRGFAEASLFHGDYEVTVKHPLTNSLVTRSLRVTRDGETFDVRIIA